MRSPPSARAPQCLCKPAAARTPKYFATVVRAVASASAWPRLQLRAWRGEVNKQAPASVRGNPAANQSSRTGVTGCCELFRPATAN